MYNWLIDLLGIPAQGSSSSVVYILGAFFVMITATTLVLFVMMLDRILNGGWRK